MGAAIFSPSQAVWQGVMNQTCVQSGDSQVVNMRSSMHRFSMVDQGLEVSDPKGF
ncbi:hypothetical protein ABBQ38_001906 [Trebouxia sp. C0009 RCD-2024]